MRQLPHPRIEETTLCGVLAALSDPVRLAIVGRLADGWLPEPTVQPGRGLEAAWLEVRAAASAAGRDPDALGLQGQVWSPPDQLDRRWWCPRNRHDGEELRRCAQFYS